MLQIVLDEAATVTVGVRGLADDGDWGYLDAFTLVATDTGDGDSGGADGDGSDGGSGGSDEDATGGDTDGSSGDGTDEEAEGGVSGSPSGEIAQTGAPSMTGALAGALGLLALGGALVFASLRRDRREQTRS